MSRSKSTSGPALARRLFGGWARLTPWWWLYAPLAAAEMALVVLYAGAWGPVGPIYVLLRSVSFLAVALAAVDLSRHRAFYNRRDQARRNHDVSKGWRVLGLVIGAGSAAFGTVALVNLLVQDNQDAGSAAFFSALLAIATVYTFKRTRQRTGRSEMKS